MFRKPHGVMCKQNKLEGLIPVIRKNECWQPESSEYTLKKYTGKQNVTSLGFECENWDDEQFQSHRYKPLRANHNYCRDPSGLNGKPWCYVKSKQKWDYCPIDFCYDHDGSSEGADENELYPFLFDQFHCGKNERMNYDNAARSKLINARVANGVDSKVEQAPYMARLRYISRDVIRRF